MNSNPSRKPPPPSLDELSGVLAVAGGPRTPPDLDQLTRSSIGTESFGRIGAPPNLDELIDTGARAASTAPPPPPDLGRLTAGELSFSPASPPRPPDLGTLK